MLKLYYSPHACSMSCHITLEESKLPFETSRVDLSDKDGSKTKLQKINATGAVPALELNDGKVLTQNVAILEYIADQQPSANLLAPIGSYERADILRWVSFISSDLHKSYGLLFHLDRITPDKALQEPVKRYALNQIEKYLTMVENQLQGRQFLVADRFTIADAYLFTVYAWSQYVNVATDRYSQLNAYQQRMMQRPAIKAVLNREEA